MVNIINESHGENHAIYHSDCVEFMAQMPDESIDFSIYSPPFANLYVYSDSANDMGNCKSNDEFMQQYQHCINEIHRITLSGRLTAVHCLDIPLFKGKTGHVGLSDFSGEIIKAHEKAGFIYHDRITIWKNPVVEMQRTKAVGLLHKTIRKDSSMSRTGIPDYLLVFRKKGENPKPISHSYDEFPIDTWQQFASPVWMDINQGYVLNHKIAKDDKDEKHLCPLQLDVIERANALWSSRGDTVFSPFAGIGSEGYMSIKMGRKFIGTELKDTYYKYAVKNLQDAESNKDDLFKFIG